MRGAKRGFGRGVGASWLATAGARSGNQEVCWRDSELFEGLSTAEVALVEPLVVECELSAGETLVSQGTPALELFVVCCGQLEVVKRDDDDGGLEHIIDRVHPGEIDGEVALFDQLPRYGTTRATTACRVARIAFHDLKPTHDLMPRSSLDPRPKPIRQAYRKLMENLIAALAEQVRQQTHASFQSAKRQRATGKFLVNILVLLCAYSFFLTGLGLLGDKVPGNTTLLSIPVQLVFAVGSWRFIRSTGYPLEEFGIGRRELGGSLGEAALLTGLVLGLVTAIKWALLRASGSAGALIEHPDVLQTFSDPITVGRFGIYAFSCVVQELIVRSALQSSLEMFLPGHTRVAKAVLISALLFAMTHLHLSFSFAALVFIPGVFWGWLFARHRNLAGVSLSHISVGAYMFFVLGTQL